MIECVFYEPWTQVSKIVKSTECHLWDCTQEKCKRNETCEKPWATLTNRVRTHDNQEGED